MAEANNREEIVSLLNEFSVDKTKIEKIDLPEEEAIQEEVIRKNRLETESKPANMVVKISEPIKMNIRNASDTAKLVMKKVVIVLEPKKFNGTRDKLAEAEKELAERKKQEELLKEAYQAENTVNLETDGNQEIKINIPNEEVSIPTEVFIEEPEEKTIDLFSETDPFLDDNEFEKNDNNREDKLTEMPEIKNIGTVKPNSVLSQLEEISKENEDIILPTMGLTDNNKVDVPIVSENYIK